jgi:hypothetical protein
MPAEIVDHVSTVMAQRADWRAAAERRVAARFDGL